MQSQVHEIDPVTVELSVEVPWDRVQKGLDAGYGKLRKHAKVRGFRPGKVPRNVLQKIYGKQVQGEVVSTLVEEGLLEAVQEHELAVVASPQLESLPSIEKGQPLAFTAKLEVRPKVEDVSTEGIELKRPVSEVTDAEVDAEIEKLREQHAEIITPDEPRPAKEGDLLEIDYTVEIDAEEKPDMAAQGRQVELGAGRLLPEFEEALTGKKPGDEVDVRIAYGEDVAEESLKNKRALFKVTIQELKEKVLPELDDELAKDLGEYETLDELRQKTREELEEAAKNRADGELREQVIEALVEKNPVPVPPSLVQQQQQQMMQELMFYMQLAGQQGGLDPEMLEDMKGRAEKKVRAALLMGALADQQGLKVEPEEVDAKLQEIADETGKHIAKVRVEFSGDKREGLENKLLEDKLLDYLMSQATITDAPPEEASEDAEGQDAADDSEAED
ncbi:MAG TPA: trigger factor [Sandaracinaceae bacterium LLY-WYZ-13_1]|nr:trigger factor [Sandaracinaceae bacterium LLY-WYZ-13_1]